MRWAEIRAEVPAGSRGDGQRMVRAASRRRSPGTRGGPEVVPTCGRQGYPGTANADGVAAAPPAATGPGRATGRTSRGTSPRRWQQGQGRRDRRGQAPWQAGGAGRGPETEGRAEPQHNGTSSARRPRRNLTRPEGRGLSAGAGPKLSNDGVRQIDGPAPAGAPRALIGHRSAARIPVAVVGRL